MPHFTFYSLPRDDPWSPTANNMILHMPPKNIVVGDHGNVEVGLGDASVDSTIGLSSVVSRSNHHRAVNNTRHQRPMSGYMPTLGENPSLSSSSSSGFDDRRRDDHEHHQKRQSNNAASSSVFGGSAMHPHIQELVERQRQKKRGGEASSSPGTYNHSWPRRQDREDDIRHRQRDHSERRENPFVEEPNNPHVIRGLINSYRDDFVSVSPSTYTDPHRPKLQQPPFSPLTLRTKPTREQQQIEQQQHVVNDDEEYVMMMEIKGQGCACQALDDVAYLFGCGTKPEDEVVSLFVQRKADSNSENGGDKRQEYMNPNAMKTNQDYETMMLSLKSKENAHRQYQHIKNGWLDPHLCGHKTGYDGSSGVKSTWSFSHLLDYVQTRGGCQLPSGGDEVLSPKSRKTRRSEKKLVMKRSESTEDSAFHRMANVVDELKCQLKSMRSERQSEVRDDVVPTLSDSHESFDFLVPKPLDENALQQQQQQQTANQFQQSANQFTVGNSTGATPFQPLSPMAAYYPAFTPFGGQPVSTSPMTSFTRFTYPPQKSDNPTVNNYMDSPVSPNNAAAMMGNTSGVINGMGNSSTYTMLSSLPGYPMNQQTPFQSPQTSFQPQQTSFQPQAQLPQIFQEQYQQPKSQESIPQYQQSTASMPQQAHFGSSISNNYNPTTYQQWNPPQTRDNPTPPTTYKPFPVDTRSKSMPSGTSRPVYSATRPTTNNDEYQQTNQILNELKMKNELMQQDIQRMMINDTKRAGGSIRPLASAAESRQHPSIISAKERLAQAMQKPQPSAYQSRQPSTAPSQRRDNTQGYR